MTRSFRNCMVFASKASAMEASGRAVSVSRTESVLGRWARLINRFHMGRASHESAVPSFVFQPEPRMVGRLSAGRQLCAGKFLFAGSVAEAPDRMIWDIEMPSAAFERELHGFAWLDDLAAVGGSDAEERARNWTLEWIRRFGRRTGPGWSPECAGQRLLRWISHSACLLDDLDEQESKTFRGSLGHQIRFLSNRWQGMPRGHSRFETLTGLVLASLTLDGTGIDSDHVIAALAEDCDRGIDSSGSIPCRNPEELLDILSLLTWARSALAEMGKITPAPVLDSIRRMASTLRTLRHSDGSLARFHGGGCGIEGRLDHALANSGVRRHGEDVSAMGFVRLLAGRTSLIIDAERPPAGSHVLSHASTLAFEMTSGRRPLVVNCGSGVPFGAEWAKAGQTTALHSALEIDGNSSSVFDPQRRESMVRHVIIDAPKDVRVRRFSGIDGKSVHASHDGYVPTHGLVHVRAIQLSPDGRRVSGDDTLTAASDQEVRQFDRIRDRMARPGIPFSIRFHLHPNVTVQADLSNASVSLRLKSGEIWIFRHEGPAMMQLQPSIYLERGLLVPRETSQIVLSARATAYVTHVRWMLERAEELPVHIRDVTRDENEVPG